MKLIVGLGNPGPKYTRTRHNVGFRVTDELLRRSGATPKDKFRGEFALVGVGTEQFGVLKPQTFMNVSGESVRLAVEFYGILPADILVVHDELDLPLGRIRLKVGGGHAGHNGLRSIIQHCGPEFVRIRCGIGGKLVSGPTTNFVLGNFGQDEEILAAKMIDVAADMIEHVLQHGPLATMNRYHSEV